MNKFTQRMVLKSLLNLTCKRKQTRKNYTYLSQKLDRKAKHAIFNYWLTTAFNLHRAIKFNTTNLLRETLTLFK